MIEEVVFRHVDGDPDLRAVVDGRFFHDFAPQGTELPYVVLTLDSTEPEYETDGESGMARTTVEFLIRANSRDELRAARAAVLRRVARLHGPVEGFDFQSASVREDHNAIAPDAGDEGFRLERLIDVDLVHTEETHGVR